MYHGVSHEANRRWGPWQYDVTPERFENQIEWLAANRTVVPLERILQYISGDESVPNDAVAITFDDGYENFADQALPILQQYDMQSIVYVSTRLMEQNIAPYEHRLAVALQNAEEISVRTSGIEIESTLSTSDAVRAAYEKIREQTKGSGRQVREELLEQIGRTEADEYRIMSSKVVSEISAHPIVSIGSHSHEHRPLEELSRAVIRRNMLTSINKLSDVINESVSHFSFPYGSTSSLARQLAKEVGYDTAVTTAERTIQPQDWGKSYNLPRVDMSHRSHSLTQRI